MINTHLNSVTSRNPAWALYKAKEQEILGVRQELFGELDRDSKIISNAAQVLLTEKLRHADTPLMGELFPWIIKDLAGLSSKTTRDISVGWLAIYLYTIFIDRHLDEKINISADQFLAGSLLAKVGLLKLHKIVIGTKYESLFDESLRESARFELDDVLDKSRIGLDKEEHASGKNKILLVCAAALAAATSPPSLADAIVAFSRSLLLSLQYLDDIGDWKEDFDQGNMTVLLSGAAVYVVPYKNGSFNFKKASRDEILECLIYSGSLRRVLTKTITLLETSQQIFKPASNHNKEIPDSIDYFFCLTVELHSLNEELIAIEEGNSVSSIRDKRKILERVETKIRIIAQSS